MSTTTTTTTTTTPSTSALLEKMLTKAQIATASALSSLDFDDLRTIASNGKGASKKLALDFVASADLDNAFERFARSDCKNVRPLAILVRSITGKFTDTDSVTGLTACPTNRAGFLEYPADVAIWSKASANDKTNATRAKLLAMVNSIIGRAQGMVNAYYAEAEATAKQAEAEATAKQAEAEATSEALSYCLDNAMA